MSYVYSKNQGFGATRGEVLATPEPIPEPVFVPTPAPRVAYPESVFVPTPAPYDPSISYVEDPQPAEPTLELSYTVPQGIEQYAYLRDRIVAGPTPVLESPLNVSDAPVALPTRFLESVNLEMQLQTAQQSLEQAMRPMTSVDTRFADPSLFTDVPIRPTLPRAEMPVELASQPPREMTSNYESVVRSTSLAPAAYEVMPEPTVSSAMQSRGGSVLTESPEPLLIPVGKETKETYVSRRDETLFDDPHPNLLETFEQQPVTGTKYDTILPPMTDTVPVEPGGMPPKSCPSGYYYDSTLNNCMVNQPLPASTRTSAELKAGVKVLCAKMASMCPNISPALLDEAVVVAGAVVDKYFPNGIANVTAALSKFPADVQSRVNGLLGKWVKASTCDEIAPLFAETVAFLKNPAGGSASGGMGLPLIAGAAALALLLFRR
jgi:hypothetical protein